jgi:diacylglycerol kinase (ATP)
MLQKLQRQFGARSRSFGHAVRGLCDVLASQPNARVHLAATIGVGAAGIACGLGRLEWCLISLAVASVWSAEALNTALERACDAACPARDPRIGRAKDAAAAAVLIAAVGAALIGALVFVPHLAAVG